MKASRPCRLQHFLGKIVRCVTEGSRLWIGAISHLAPPLPPPGLFLPWDGACSDDRQDRISATSGSSVKSDGRVGLETAAFFALYGPITRRGEGGAARVAAGSLRRVIGPASGLLRGMGTASPPPECPPGAGPAAGPEPATGSEPAVQCGEFAATLASCGGVAGPTSRINPARRLASINAFPKLTVVTFTSIRSPYVSGFLFDAIHLKLSDIKRA
jgi:hypothetical protein